MSGSSEAVPAAPPPPTGGPGARPPSPARVQAGPPATAEATVRLPVDLHARPAGALARAAAGFRSGIRVEHAGRSVSPTGILAVMGLGATRGTDVTVRAEGEDAAAAVAALARVLTEAE
ncbi:hypothetical protein GCM10010495_58240 [Kitasatospora herbaricolor]|uniref:HPr family phosphocarrier protein n=1 Tax=Kitasatospora herbaricolor TaxID=68217 RepID=UPI001748056C|nr:HPr family phosphocarrier protein [Kitasatospora herbaricolor]MDQ0306580.1 phosphotransferase system HPr (HPr) family protein [Kitasatospora herbaricolor]GGV33725.1 hypothetical protein GCM10010495_58240 [Kitasatospora herbaricolor]